MDWWQLLLNLPSIVINTILWPVRWFTNLPLQWFWKIKKGTQTIIVLNLLETELSRSEYTLYAPFGDANAYAVIREAIRRAQPKVQIEPRAYPATRMLDSTFSNKTLISIGGGRDNQVSFELLPLVAPPIYGFDHEAENRDNKFATNQLRNIWLKPVTKNGLLIEDIAYAIRTVHPFDKSIQLFFLLGTYTHGTYGAAMWTTDLANIRRLWFNWVVRKVSEFIRLNKKTDSIEVLLKVPVRGYEIGKPRLLTSDEIEAAKTDFSDNTRSIMFFRSEPSLELISTLAQSRKGGGKLEEKIQTIR